MQLLSLPPQVLVLLLEQSSGVWGVASPKSAAAAAGGGSSAAAHPLPSSAAASPLISPEPLQPLLVSPSTPVLPAAPSAQPLPSPEPLQPLLVSLYLSCGLVGRIAELLSLMDSPMRGRLSRPVPEHVMQVWGGVWWQIYVWDLKVWADPYGHAGAPASLERSRGIPPLPPYPPPPLTHRVFSCWRPSPLYYLSLAYSVPPQGLLLLKALTSRPTHAEGDLRLLADRR